jgi:dipeptidase D
MASPIDGLQPPRLWHYFAELCAIPRCSKHEAAAARFVADTARSFGLETRTDAAGNVLVRKPATPARRSAAMVALQSHLDMVGEKNRDSVHDFTRDPIKLLRNNNAVTASGTTLGADNGIGVATALAIMEERSIRHGPLEFLFTVDEETGLNGALALRPGFLKSRILINLDSEDEGVLYVGCAGGGDTVGSMPLHYSPFPARHERLKVAVSGLRGGHSGLEIHTGRGNAIKLLARALWMLDEYGIRLGSLSGGNKRNAIPREAEAAIAVPSGSFECITARVAEIENEFKAEYVPVDPGVTVALSRPVGKRPLVMKPADQNKLIRLLYALPHGVISMSKDIPGLVETSANLAMVKTSGKTAVVETSQRSSVESRKRDVVHVAQAAFELAGARVKQESGYPAWKPDLSSPILKVAQETYRGLFQKEAVVTAVHAGLECGIIGENYPGMDMLSLGPTLQMVHSPEERVLVDSVERYWGFLSAILERV